MSTSIKVVTRNGRYGLIMHQHGEGAWHPAHQAHGAKVDPADRHEGHEVDGAAVLAQLKTYATADLSYATLKAEYLACLRGESNQPFWHEAWKAGVKGRAAKAAPAPSIPVSYDSNGEPLQVVEVDAGFDEYGEPVKLLQVIS